MSDTVFKFGAGKACTSIEVAPFTPICSKPAVPGSEALTLEVPAPVFAPVVPPQECACFAFTKSEKPQVTVTMAKRSDLTSMLEAGKAGTGTASVGIAATGDCCNGAYEVTPTIDITVPECVTADHVIYSNTTALGYGGSITCTLGIRDCVPYFEMSSVPVSITLPNIPNLCLGPTSIEVKATYIDANGTEQTATSGSVTVSSSVDDNSCQKYSFGTINLDLTDLPTGGFGNGGSVFKASNDNNLYLDGTIDVEKPIWYGGGLGNLATDNPRYVICRGPKMMGRDNDYANIAGNGDHLVPHDSTKQFHLVKADADKTTAVAWHSSRKAKDTDAEGNPVYSVDTSDITPAEDPTTGETIPEGSRVKYVGGNLSMVLPSGFQWHERGLALNLSHFFWNDSGMLSVLEEEPYAALVSPAPMVFNDNAPAYTTSTTTSAPRAGAAAGGLRINPDTDTTLGTEPGLYIAAGDGLRVFGLDTKTPSEEGADASGVTAAGRIGQLEVMYGPGFRVRKANSGTTPQYLDKPVDAAGALVPNDGRGLRVHGVTKTATTESDQKNKLEVYGHSGDFLFNYDGKMVINDQPNAAGITEAEVRLTGGASAAGPYLKDVYKRDRDCTISLLTTWIDSNNAYWSMHTNTAGKGSVYKVDTALLDQQIDTAEGAIWEHTTSGHNIKAIFGNSANPNTATWQLALACAALLDAVIDIEETISRLAVVRMHFGKAGTLMSADSESSCAASASASNLVRHYAASAS